MASEAAEARACYIGFGIAVFLVLLCVCDGWLFELFPTSKSSEHDRTRVQASAYSTTPNLDRLTSGQRQQLREDLKRAVKRSVDKYGEEEIERIWGKKVAALADE